MPDPRCASLRQDRARGANGATGPAPLRPVFGQQLLGHHDRILAALVRRVIARAAADLVEALAVVERDRRGIRGAHLRSEEHTSELQSRENLVCRLLLEKKKKNKKRTK